MASRYYGVPKGKNTQTGVTEAASTNSMAFEFVVDLATSPTQEQALLALSAIEDYIISGQWPPA